MDVAPDGRRQLEALALRLIRNELDAVVRDLLERKRRRLKIELSGLDLRKIQNVVDYAQQTSPGVSLQFHEMPLPLG